MDPDCLRFLSVLQKCGAFPHISYFFASCCLVKTLACQVSAVSWRMWQDFYGFSRDSALKLTTAGRSAGMKRFLWTEWGSIDVLMLHCCVTLWYWHRFNMFKIWLETKFSQVFTKQIFMPIYLSRLQKSHLWCGPPCTSSSIELPVFLITKY